MTGYLIAVVLFWQVPGEPSIGLYKAVKVFEGKNISESVVACYEKTKALGFSFKMTLPVEIANSTKIIFRCEFTGYHS